MVTFQRSTMYRALLLSETNLSDGSTPSGAAVSQTETITVTNQSDDVASFRIEPGQNSMLVGAQTKWAGG
ncbi:hypothetical protein OK016_01215 [Vibrio chagasii]|nr:hypothetical protein [Vibrio chagasii]